MNALAYQIVLRCRPSVLLILLGLAACASDPVEPPTPLQIEGAKATTLVVAPFNIALLLPDELKSSTRMVASALFEHLKTQGKTSHFIDAGVAGPLWIDSINQIKGTSEPQNFESAARVFAAKVGQSIRFDAMILPSLYVQNAVITPESARWDGANQRIEFIGRARQTIEMPPLTTLRAASLLVYVLDPNGNPIHIKRTGLELMQHMEVRVEKTQGYDKRIWEPEDDVPVIEDEARVRAAVAHALHPFLAK